MKRFIDIAIFFSLFTISFLIFGYSIIISSDIPVTITEDGIISFIIINLIYIILQLIYIIKSKEGAKISNIFLLVAVIAIWIINLIQDLTYQYHKYSVVTSCIGLISMICILILYILKYRRTYINTHT
ncbi:hypothetical protein IRP63_15925 (plasmid) [Clostridium botulinum]|uniref:Heme transporter CcmA n=1 Tax=Clostridium botulinum C/D str. DC5 TaxID=1443128 RepID=A0A0A0I054_CLOBO|nr:hypothetical protein [Clostridium botulinum]KEH99951.1 hypothetical protein Z952_14595 [Clostridium botulinum C/D str. BKT75002]KEI05673.1 hypothetical protein Z954_14775 [Clostridium botulinum C/D str. BKT2873]KGM93015.1 hypothetical protein Z955_16315 [Clostridium botulinum C/D str. DC5]KOC51942.1 hypothetical protein ADU90_15010 [Clostridium botulinum]KOC56611.1 hypothetical protein ADU89_02480 [Clostridium botulinum]